MNKILTMLGSILIFTGLKAQDTTKVRKETTPVKEIKSQQTPANNKVLHKVDAEHKLEGKVYPKIEPQYKVEANSHKVEGKVFPKVEAKDYKVEGKTIPKVEAKDYKIEGKTFPKVEAKGEVIPKVESKKTGN